MENTMPVHTDILFRCESSKQELLASILHFQVEGEFCDLLLRCSDGDVPTSSLILASANPMIYSALRETPQFDDQFVVILPDTKKAEMEFFTTNILKPNLLDSENRKYMKRICSDLGVYLSDNYDHNKTEAETVKPEMEETTVEMYMSLQTENVDNQPMRYEKEPPMQRPKTNDQKSSKNPSNASNMDTTKEIDIEEVDMEEVDVDNNVIYEFNGNKSNKESREEGSCNCPDPECGKGYSKPVSESAGLNCGECRKTFKTYQTLLSHFKMIHSLNGNTKKKRGRPRKNTEETSKKVFCSHCPSLFTLKSELIDHVKKRHNKKNFQCEVCDESFFKSSGLNMHRIMKHFSIPCPNCPARFRSENQYQNHSVLHSGKENVEKEISVNISPSKSIPNLPVKLEENVYMF